MNQRTNRRQFIQTATAGAAGLMLAPSGVFAAAEKEKLNVALIGVGARGAGFIKKLAQMDQNLVAICDADTLRMEKNGLPDGVRKFQDFRKLLDEMDSKIDSVIIATPHHTQPAIAGAAMRRNKHVYCEKPIAHDVGEARAIRKLTNEKPNLITQMGNQGVATDSFRRTLEQVQDGAAGEIREAHQWYAVGPRTNPDFRPQPADPTQKPGELNWDLFVGPKPMRPYDWKYMRWAGWRDFGTGMLGMGGAHSCHMTFNALNLRALWNGNGGKPCNIRVSAECSQDEKDRSPDWEVVKFEFPARGEMPPAKLTWSKGPPEELRRLGITANLEKLAGRSLDWGSGWAPTSGSLLVGAKGLVHTNMHNSECALLPLDRFPNQSGPPKRLPHSGSHEREWVNACRGEGPKPFSNFAYAGPVIELMLLGNICTLLGRPIEFDPVAGKIPNDEEANGALNPPRREGWEI
jgi:predicted dehydrogenase